MKKLIFVLAIGFGGLVFTACSDELEEVTPDFPDNQEQLMTGEEDSPDIPPRG